MAIDVYSFTWNIVETGFGWVQARVMEDNTGLAEKPEWVLASGSAIGHTIMTIRPYAPLTEFPGLYRTFAEVPFADRNAILAFANKYGDLGIGRYVVPADPPPPAGPMPLMGGEKHKDWAQAIERMRQAVMIWDWFMGRDTANLARYIRWSDAEYEEDGRTPKKAAGWYYDSQPHLPRSQVAAPYRTYEVIQPVLDLFKPRDVLTPASFLVQRWINDQLTEHAAPHLVYHVDYGKRVIQIAPDSLLTAMWLQFARAIEGNKEFRACKECGRWIEVSHRQADGRTKRREFCSDACKSKDYRKRRDIAAKEAAAKPATPKRRRPSK